MIIVIPFNYEFCEITGLIICHYVDSPTIGWDIKNLNCIFPFNTTIDICFFYLYNTFRKSITQLWL